MTAAGSLAAALIDRCLPTPSPPTLRPAVGLAPIGTGRRDAYTHTAVSGAVQAVQALVANRQHGLAAIAYGVGVALKRAGATDRETWAGDQLIGAAAWANTPKERNTVRRCIGAGIAAAVEGLPDRDPPGRSAPTPRKLHQAVDAWEAAALAFASYLPARRRKMLARVAEAVATLARQHDTVNVEAAIRIVALLAGCTPHTAWRYLVDLRAFGLLDLVGAYGWTPTRDDTGVSRWRCAGNVYALKMPPQTPVSSNEATDSQRPAQMGGGDKTSKASYDDTGVYAALWDLRPGGDLDRALRSGTGGTVAETLRAALRVGDAFTLADVAGAAGSHVETIRLHIIGRPARPARPATATRPSRRAVPAVVGLVAGDPPMIHQVEAGGGRGNPARYNADAAAVVIHAARAAGLEGAAWESARQERAARVAAFEAVLWRSGTVGRDALVQLEKSAPVLAEDSAVDDLVEYARTMFGAVVVGVQAVAVQA